MRKTVEFDYSKCIGCKDCITSCHEGALELKDGYPVVSNSFLCDGLGDCIKACKYDAIRIIEVDDNNNKVIVKKTLKNLNINKINTWPIKIELVNEIDSRFNNSDLTICADCCGYTYKEFNKEFNKFPILIGCPKLTKMNYYDKLKAILSNNIKSITLIIMEVNCCKNLLMMIKNIIYELKLDIKLKTYIVNTNGDICEA